MEDLWDDVPDAFDDDLLLGFGPPELDDFAPMAIGVGGTDDDSNAPRKRRAGDQAVEMPVKQDARASMLPFLTYRPGGNGQPQTARDELMRMTQQCKQASQQVDQLRKLQFSALRDNDVQQLGALKDTVPRVALELTQARQAIDVIPDRYLLETIEWFQVRFLQCQFGMLRAHAMALNAELQWTQAGKPLTAEGTSPFFGCVFMHEYPNCVMVPKGKQIVPAFVLEVIAGVATELRFLGPMRAAMTGMETSFGDKTLLSGQEASVDPQRRMVSFPELRAVASTRMCPGVISFSVPVSINGGPPTVIESEPSPPCLVVSHESQWVDAESKLSTYQAFGSSKAVPWQRFINTIHLRYLLLGKQDLKNPKRRLTVSDLHYFYNRFFGTAIVNVNQAEKFYAWFAPVMHQLRFKKHVLALWLMGLIFGFIEKEQCNQTLANFPEGTFLLRFSESSPGSFAIAYVSDDMHERVKHYLVKPEDIRDMSLPDFIRGKPQWIQLIRVSNGGELARTHKDDLLGRFYSNQHVPKKSGGYTLL